MFAVSSDFLNSFLIPSIIFLAYAITGVQRHNIINNPFNLNIIIFFYVLFIILVRHLCICFEEHFYFILFHFQIAICTPIINHLHYSSPTAFPMHKSFRVLSCLINQSSSNLSSPTIIIKQLSHLHLLHSFNTYQTLHAKCVSITWFLIFQ